MPNVVAVCAPNVNARLVLGSRVGTKRVPGEVLTLRALCWEDAGGRRDGHWGKRRIAPSVIVVKRGHIDRRQSRKGVQLRDDRARINAHRADITMRNAGNQRRGC